MLGFPSSTGSHTLGCPRPLSNGVEMATRERKSQPGEAEVYPECKALLWDVSIFSCCVDAQSFWVLAGFLAGVWCLDLKTQQRVPSQLLRGLACLHLGIYVHTYPILELPNMIFILDVGWFSLKRKKKKERKQEFSQ